VDSATSNGWMGAAAAAASTMIIRSWSNPGGNREPSDSKSVSFVAYRESGSDWGRKMNCLLCCVPSARVCCVPRRCLAWELWKKSEAFAAEVPVPRIAPLPSLHEFCKKDQILGANEVVCGRSKWNFKE
jgi:hypothetical protein